MGHEFSRIVIAIILSGLVLFAWNYYLTAFNQRSSESVTVVEQGEKQKK